MGRLTIEDCIYLSRFWSITLALLRMTVMELCMGFIVIKKYISSIIVEIFAAYLCFVTWETRRIINLRRLWKRIIYLRKLWKLYCVIIDVEL